MANRKYTADDAFFSRDTPEAFYWAGFIAADGCVRIRNGKHKNVRIELAEKDASHLEKIKTAIKYTGDIKHYKYQKKKAP